MFPPHLPPPTSDLARHRQWQRLKQITIASLFGIMAGLSGAAIMLGWIWPLSSAGESLFFTRNSPTIPREQLQTRAQLKIANEIFTIYQKSSSLGKARYFSPEDKVADSLMSVTSGWVLAYVPNFDGRFKDWVAVAEDGSLYNITKALLDKRTGLTYFKLDPLIKKPDITDEQFKVVTFNGGVNQYDEVFVRHNGHWVSTLVTGESVENIDSHLDSASVRSYELNDSFAKGSIVVDAQGNVIGFVSGGSTILALQNEEFFLSGIDDKKEIIYPSLGLEGWFSSEKLLVLDDEKINGFIVTKVVGNKQYFQKGDILLEVNGRVVDRVTLWQSVNSPRARVSVLRAGKTLELQVPIIQL